MRRGIARHHTSRRTLARAASQIRAVMRESSTSDLPRSLLAQASDRIVAAMRYMEEEAEAKAAQALGLTGEAQQS